MAIDLLAPGADEAELRDALHKLRTFMGVRVRMTADDTAQNIAGVDAEISFDEATFDTDGFWSGGAPERLTIPADLGITHVYLNGQISISSTTGDTQTSSLIRHYNQSSVEQRNYGSRFMEQGTTARVLNNSTGPVEVADGHYFVMTAREETDTSVTIEGDTTSRCVLSLYVLAREFTTD